MILVALRAAYAARRIEMPAEIEVAVTRLVPPLLGIAHGDRGLSSWQGGGPIAGDVVDAAIAASGVGNAVATVVVARWEGELDREKLNAALSGQAEEKVVLAAPVPAAE